MGGGGGGGGATTTPSSGLVGGLSQALRSPATSRTTGIGESREAVETFRRIYQADPNFPFVQTFCTFLIILDGRVDEALTLWQPGAEWPVHAFVKLGKRAEAERIATEHAAFPFRMAIISAALGNAERAADEVERVAASEPHRVGRLLAEHELVKLRDHPRIAAVRKAFNLP